MKTMFRTAALVAGCLSLGACAATKHGPEAKQGPNAVLDIRTTPAGASVSTSNGQSCEPTPCAVPAPANAEFTANVSKPGYQSAHVKVSHGLFGRKPKRLKLALKPAQQAAKAAPPPMSSPSSPPPRVSAQATAAPSRDLALADNAQPWRKGRVIAMRVMPDGSVIETHSPFD